MPTKVNLVSPPDTIFNHNFSIVLINTTAEEQEKVSFFLAKQTDTREINIFVYNNEKNPTWLLNHVNGKLITYINVDNSSDISVQYLSYMLSQGNTYFSTNEVNSKEMYTLLNTNLVATIDEFLKKVYPDEQH